MRKTLRKIFFLVNILMTLALLGAYLSVYIPPDVFWIPALFGMAYPFLLLINLFFVVFWIDPVLKYVMPNCYLKNLLSISLLKITVFTAPMLK